MTEPVSPREDRIDDPELQDDSPDLPPMVEGNDEDPE